MKKQIDKKKQKLRTTSWFTITSTLIAIGGQLLVKNRNASIEHHEEEHLCGSGAMSDLLDDSLHLNLLVLISHLGKTVRSSLQE